MDDHIEILKDNWIHHLGRIDKIIKYCGKRYSLIALEKKLDAAIKNRSCKLVFIEDSNHTKGGTLIAYIEHDNLSVLDFKGVKKAFQGFPIPKIKLVDKLPRNTMGKINIEELKTRNLDSSESVQR